MLFSTLFIAKMMLFKFIFMAIFMNTFAYETTKYKTTPYKTTPYKTTYPVTENDWFPGPIKTRKDCSDRKDCRKIACLSDPVFNDIVCENGRDGSRMSLPNQGRYIHF